MSDQIHEQELPGIGRRYSVLAEGGEVSIVIHHSGRRDIYLADSRGHAPPAVASLSDDQARRLGAVLAGAYFQPTLTRQIEAVVGGLLIDWVTVRADSPGAGRSIADLQVRRQTRMTIVAILRGGNEVVMVPEPTEVLQAGDRVVVVGRPDDLDGFVRHVAG
ncbi:MAG TPA: TrkA C-terminal domain-containing protein [Acidimicrobiales bacterium]|nr:TrkA C-terminal domain-containing protein [Acidimicrobiales bacterium]